VDASTAEKRFWAKVLKRSSNECWSWQATTTQGGYGLFRVTSARRVSAARFAYELDNGPLEAGLQILHLCHNKICCNPAHLRAGTSQENCLHDSVSGKVQRNTPELTGVRWKEARQVWQAQGTVDGKAKCLYHGPSKEAAIAARQQWEAAIEHERLSFLPTLT